MRQGYQLLRLAKLKMFLTHSFYVRLNAHAQFKHKECQNQVKVLTNLAHFNLPFKPLFSFPTQIHSYQLYNCLQACHTINQLIKTKAEGNKRWQIRRFIASS